MSTVEEHRSQAGAALRFAVLVVSTSRTLDDDRSGRRIVELLEEAGHEVAGRTLVTDDIDAVRGAVRSAAGVHAVVLTGGTGLAPLDLTPEAVEPLFSRRIDGFGELFRYLSWQQVGAAAMLSRATAGVLHDGTVVFALPGSVKACELAIRELVLPEIGHLVSLAAPSSRVAASDRPEAGEPTVGDLPGGGLAVTELAADLPTPETREPLPAGWMRAVQTLGGEVLGGVREVMPASVAAMAPVRNVLETAGESGVMRVGPRRYALYGFPDLRRPSSKVLAVGVPSGEVVALHRQPLAGTWADHGLLPYSGGVAEVAEAVTGRAPRDPSGALFAVSGKNVWIERGGRVFRFDGRAERDEGTPAQVLASLVLDWHAR